MKVVKCNQCDGTGKYSKYFTTESKDNIVKNIYMIKECEFCKGKGKVIVDNLTYQINLNEIRHKRHNHMKALKEFKSNESDSLYLLNYTVTDKCDCNYGVISKEEQKGKDYIIETVEYCTKCNGTGEILNKKKTFEVINKNIDKYSELIREIDNTNNNSKSEQLENREVKRDYIRYSNESRYNICLNCINFNSYNCANKCKHNGEDTVTAFQGIDKASNNWYNKYCRK